MKTAHKLFVLHYMLRLTAGKCSYSMIMLLCSVRLHAYSRPDDNGELLVMKFRSIVRNVDAKLHTQDAQFHTV